MKENPLRKLQALGQSIWLDYIRRDLMSSGELRRLIAEGGLRGITSNPAIFESSITGSHDYDVDIRGMALQGKSVMAIDEALSQCDVQRAADEFRRVCDSTDAADGTSPVETLDAYRDHGDPKTRIEDDVEQAGPLLERLPQLGISIDNVVQQLENEGVEKSTTPFDKLLATIRQVTNRN